MLERLVAWVLNSYIGEYFGNVNTDQLSVALHQGEVELEGLPLKVDSLRHWGLPVEVKAGYISKIRLKIPVYRLRTEPWKITIEELYLVAHSLRDFTYHEAVEKQSMQEYKLNLLDAIELRWKSQYESAEEQSYYASTYTSWLSLGTSIVTSVIENVQLVINSVHIRYEDSTSVKGCCLACGLVIRNLSAHSADEDANPRAGVTDFSNCLRKSVSLEGFDFYWDPDVKLIGDLQLPEIISFMRDMMGKSFQFEDSVCSHDYLLSGITGKAHLIRNLSEKPLRSRLSPRFYFTLRLEDFPLTLNVVQYKQMLEWADEFSRTSTVWKYRKWRPTVDIMNSPVEWWKYAINAHLDQWRTAKERRRREFVLRRVKDILEYRLVYFIHVTQPEALTKEMKQAKDRIESDLNFDEICIIRELVFDMVKKANKQPAAPINSDSSGWLNWITSWSNQVNDDPSTEIPTDSNAVSVTPKRESLEEHFIFDNIENETFLRRDTVFAQVDLAVEKASFTLLSDAAAFSNQPDILNLYQMIHQMNMKPILELEFSAMRAFAEWRPRSRAYTFDIKLKGLYIKDKLHASTVFEHVVSPQKAASCENHGVKTTHRQLMHFAGTTENRSRHNSQEDQEDKKEEEDLFQLMFQRKPFSADYATELASRKKLYIRSRPLEIVYNQKTFDALMRFFSSKKSSNSDAESVKSVARTHYEELKKQTKAGIQSAVDDLLDGGSVKEAKEPGGFVHRTKWSIQLDIRAPQILMPEDLSDLNSTLVIFDLGRLQFKNTKSKMITWKDEYLASRESDIFVTPSESPNQSDSDSEQQPPPQSPVDIQQAIQNAAYEQYTLDLSDIQVLVGKLGNNWHFGLARGAGPMHVLNRFSISLQMERRISKQIRERNLPRVILRGSLPNLTAYLNEHKMIALSNCFRNIFEKTQATTSFTFPAQEASADENNPDQLLRPRVERLMEKEILHCQFCVEEVSIAVQSQGENLVEFQIFGVELKFERKSHRNVVSLCVHGLLLIDAHQKYGSEFDVLLASHRDVRIIDGGKSSEDLREADASTSLKLRLKTDNKTDSLITAQYVINTHDEKQTISVLFNSLDVVANQETIIEIVGFFKRILPSSQNYQTPSSYHVEASHPAKEKSHFLTTDLHFDFKRLNILLLKASYFSNDNDVIDRKVATATMNGFSVSAHIDLSDITIEGSLYGLHLVDLINDVTSTKHQEVLSVSAQSAAEGLAGASTPNRFQPDAFYQTFSKLWEQNNEKALTFTISRNNRDDTVKVSSKVSSLCYDHSSKLFKELTLCASEFKHYMSVMVNTIKSKATEVAREIVSKVKSELHLDQIPPPMEECSSNSQQRSSVREVVVVLELSKLNMRLSYNDFAMIAHILNSLPKQTTISFHSSASGGAHDGEEEFFFVLPSQLKKLQSLGFSKEDCIRSLQLCEGNLNEAALWLTQNARHSISDESAGISLPLKKLYTLMSFHVKNATLCVIDDCKDTDVPLFEMGFVDVEMSQKMCDMKLVGTSKSVVLCDYYNRALSGWEPFLEPWKADLNWEFEARENSPSRLCFGFDSDQPLNIVVTSSLIDLCKTVYQNWIDDYNQRSEISGLLMKQHSLFIPFAIKNDTGCKLYFYTVTSSRSDGPCDLRTPPVPSVSDVSKLLSYITGEQSQSEMQQRRKHNWIAVEPNEVIPFLFDDPSIVRHQNSHLRRSHKIVVQVEGWQQVFPVSVDKVGKYFREAKSENIQQESARIVFDISLEVNARKMITVRSALLLHNGTKHAVEVLFEYGKENLYLMPDLTMPVPLKLIRSRLWIRPCEVGVNKCSADLEWEHVKKPRETCGALLQCSPISLTRQEHSSYSPSLTYYISVIVNRFNFPPDQHYFSTSPGHQISLLPPLQIMNLLPYELKFNVENSVISDSIRPGQNYQVHFVNTTKEFSLRFTLDNFPKSNPLTIIPSTTKHFASNLEMFDRKDRPLVLIANVTLTGNGAFAYSVVISSPYWLVNRTGLPLVFKQEGIDHEASGQFEEHEVARSILPLLFSFCKTDASLTCKMRLGKSLGRACWGVSFFLEKGCRVRRLRIASQEPQRPDRVYEIGISVRNGKGRYRDTHIVTFSPRYQLENSSSLKLLVTQRFATYSEDCLNDTIISVLPQSHVPFHWPKTDQDKLLCVKIADLANCHWSGGFAIEVDSFHINIRDENAKSHFLRVEILLEAATYFVVFSDATNLPPPIRVDNFSEVPVEFYQTNATHSWMKTTVRPKSSAPYAWDESTLKPYITASAPGGCSATYNMNSLRPGDNLTYENFFYIAFTGTFLNIDSEQVTMLPYNSNDIKSMQLVLEVPEGSKEVVIQVKEPGKRSQLWRMGSDAGRIYHEGSSPPKDPRKAYLRNDRNDYVLDISCACAIPGEQMPLMIRKIDSKRGYTQFWTFTSDGRLSCEHPNLYVQPKDGFLGLKVGNAVVLAPPASATYLRLESSIPFEQALSIQKMRKGSGMLAIQVLNDGPTRVLQIVDVRNGSRNGLKPTDQEKSVARSEAIKKGLRGLLGFELKLNVTSSLGVSLVSRSNDELVYIYFGGVLLEYNYKLTEHFLNGSIKYFQVDNQLRNAEKPVVLHCSELEPNDPKFHLPVIRLSIHKLILPHVEAEFFELFQVKISDLTFNLEEYLLLKLFQFFGYPKLDSEMNPIDENEGQNAHQAITSAISKSPRLYFAILEVELDRVKLSVLTTSHLSDELIHIKKKTGLRLIRFEDVGIPLLPFRRNYSLETFHFLCNGMFDHYKLQLKSQSAKILGAVDFLGNPLGLMNDFTDGLNELITEGSVTGLITNVAHGISDSTAKFTSALSNSLGAVALDKRHEEIRKRIKQESNDHFQAGLKGLGVGLFGGVVSIITQTYQGYASNGAPGVLTGFGKGVVGTFTKPAVGMLDFATSAASAVRETSRKASTATPCLERVRPPRQAFDICGFLLPRYNFEPAAGQQFFYRTSSVIEKDEEEVFISFQEILPDMAVLLTTEKVRFINWGDNPHERAKIQVVIEFENLSRCQTFTEMSVPGSGVFRYYVVLTVDYESCVHKVGRFEGFAELKRNQLRIKAYSRQTAVEVTDQINCAKTSYQERKFTLVT